MGDGQKSLFIAYVLWLFGGFWGLHHLYLGRERHAFVWWATLGGCLGLGWFRDLWRLPDYVEEANLGKDWMEWKSSVMRRVPQFAILRFIGQLILGTSCGVALVAGIPADFDAHSSALSLLTPLAIAIGVHTVGNIGLEKASFRTAVLSAYLVSPMFFFKNSNVASAISQSALASSIAVQWKGRTWRSLIGRPRRHFVWRLMVLCVCCFLYSSLWFSAFYNNAYVTTRDGQKVRVKDALGHFFDSPAWQETKATTRRLWDYYWQHGFSKTWTELVRTLDPEGEDRACKILGIPPGSSESQISSAYRSLVKQWHPDRVSDPGMKQTAERRFMEIQKAYETLSSIKGRRVAQNRKQRPVDQRSREEL